MSFRLNYSATTKDVQRTRIYVATFTKLSFTCMNIGVEKVLDFFSV